MAVSVAIMNSWDGAVDSLISENEVEVIFAEAVGSCTDIVATVMKPLLHLREGVNVSISVFRGCTIAANDAGQ
jgi:hypothetical protein